MKGIFIIHSQSNAWHKTFYDQLSKWAQTMNVKLIQYSDWVWKTPRGVTTSRYKADLREHFETDLYDIDGVGKVPLNSETAPLHYLPGGRFCPRNEMMNRYDLMELITNSRVVLLVEDEDEDNLTAGMLQEKNIAQDLRVKKINIRFFRSFEDTKEDSIYQFSTSYPVNQHHVDRSPRGNYANRLTVYLRKCDNGGLDESSFKVATLAIAIACEDDWAGGDWGTGVIDQGYLRQYAPVRLNLYPVLSGMEAYIADSFAQLIDSDVFFIRRRAMLSVLCTNSGSLIAHAAREAAVKMVSLPADAENIEKLDEFGQFMCNTRGLGWGQVIALIKRNTGFGISFEDGSHLEGL